jgi:hypothetical protein
MRMGRRRSGPCRHTGLAAGHAQHHRAQRDEGHQGLLQEEADGVQRVQGHQHGRVLDDVGQAQGDQGEEPDQGDRPEELADAAGAEALHREQRGEHQQRDGDDHGMHGRRRHLQALDRREHRDGRRDDAVAVEDGGAEQPTTIRMRRSSGRSFTAVVASASIAIRPPSPLLSARRISSTYFSETMMVIVQKMS